MKAPWAYVSGLLDLETITDPSERRATWRQAIAALARAPMDGPSPLDGLHPEALGRGVHAAMISGLVDDLDWLAAPAAGSALWALAAALPPSLDQRELGRRVLARLTTGNAETACAMATRMAQGSGKGLGSAAVRARIALIVELPIATGIADGPLALGLCSGRELAREWIGVPSTGSLPARRLAARLLERAAREAATRAMAGDEHAIRLFRGDAVREAFLRLLDDREPLVWRHVATARGLIAPWVPILKQQVLGAFAPNLDIGEWRRGATSLAAMIAVSPEAAARAAQAAIVGGGAIERDPGVAAAFVWGVARAAETEPDAAAHLLGEAVSRAPLEAAEALSEVLTEYGPAPFAQKACARALEALASTPKLKDDGAEALARDIMRDLRHDGSAGDPALREHLAKALGEFATNGARAAYLLARDVLTQASEALDTLDALAQDEDDNAEGKGGSTARRTSLAVMRDLDLTLLERHVLADLLKLGGGDGAKHEEELDLVRERTAAWILARESTARSIAEGLSSKGPRHPTLRLRRLRALLHLLDSDVGAQEDAARAARLRERWCRIATALLERFEAGPPRVLQRTLHAALARALDALVRADALDVADAVLVLASAFPDASDLTALAEASMVPDLVVALRRWSSFVAVAAPTKDPVGVTPAPGGVSEIATAASAPAPGPAPPSRRRLPPPRPAPIPLTVRYTAAKASAAAAAIEAPVSLAPDSLLGGPASGVALSAHESPAVAAANRNLAALEELGRDLFQSVTSRGESLRTALVRIHAALVALHEAQTLSALSGTPGEASVLESLESALGVVAHLTTAARGRLDPARASRGAGAAGDVAPRSIKRLELVEEEGLAVAVSRVVSGSEPGLAEEMLAKHTRELIADLPSGIGAVVEPLLAQLAALPVDRPSLDTQQVKVVVSDQLPAWVPPRRTIGGFYLLRPLGSGGAGSVFVVVRIEDRHDPNAERFALKVPDFSETAARLLTEEAFLQMFRAEASALISVPQHENLARFVTFDVAARPKPILVMELVEGVTLEHVVASRGLEMDRCFALLDDVLAGLEAMHSVGVGHLDIKPSNVVMRRGEEAVLVDFGLAGRNIRPGCATGPYGAPEVWGVAPDDVKPTPQAADVYAFGCLAFEALTGKVLFQAESEMAMISMHVAHDGFPPLLKQLGSRTGMGPLAELLYWTLRRDPGQRPSIPKVRRDIAAVGTQLGRLKWPLAV